MESLTLTILQRLSVSGIIRRTKQQDNGDLDTLTDLALKIDIPREDRNQYFRDIGNGQIMWDEAAMARAEPTTIALEKAEMRKLEEILREWKEFTVDDKINWLNPLKVAIREAHNQQATSITTKTGKTAASGSGGGGAVKSA